MYVAIGASLAGIYLILKDLFPYLEAQSTGVLHTRGHNRRRVLRAEEPDRFRVLLKNRTNGMLIGLMAVGFGVLWAFLGLLALIALIPIGLGMTALLRGPGKAGVQRAEAAPITPQDTGKS